MSSFFDEYVDIGGSGGDWVSASEKAVLMEQGIPITITDVVDDDENRYGPRFAVFALVPDPESGEETERKLGFAKVTRDDDGNVESGVESRDRMLIQMQAYLARDDAQPVQVKLEKVGRAILIRQA